MVLVATSVMNKGATVKAIYPPVEMHTVNYLFDGRPHFEAVGPVRSTIGPRSELIVSLATGELVTEKFNVSSDRPLKVTPGEHSLQATYDSRRLPFPQVWKGTIRTGILKFTVQSPSGNEAEAFKLYQQVVAMYNHPPSDGHQGKPLLKQLLTQHPHSVYVAPASVLLLPKMLWNGRSPDAVAELAEMYFSLGREDDSFFVETIAWYLAEAYYTQGRYNQVEQILPKCAPKVREYMKKRMVQQRGQK